MGIKDEIKAAVKAKHQQRIGENIAAEKSRRPVTPANEQRIRENFEAFSGQYAEQDQKELSFEMLCEEIDALRDRVAALEGS